jgi:hypothetical protein
MKPSEVRRQILADHVAVRGMLLSVEALARQVIAGERSLSGALRLEGEGLLAFLRNHMSWEDRYLAPALHAADSWGSERAEQLDSDHREQRQLLQHSLETIEDESRPAALVARNLLDLVQLLRDDIEHEETALLDERVLRDDVVGIDVETG